MFFWNKNKNLIFSKKSFFFSSKKKMTALATCRRRKYKKPLLKKCLALHLPVQESMTIDELCDIYHSALQRSSSRQTIPKTTNPMKKKLENRDFNGIARYLLTCYV